MKTFALALALSLVGCSITQSSAINYVDDSSINYKIEDEVYKALDRTGNFYSINVDLEWGNDLKIWCIPESSDLIKAKETLAQIIDTYCQVCRSYPEMSDLDIMIGTKYYIKGKMNCKREWIDEAKHDSDGKLNKSSEDMLLLRIAATYEETSK